MISVFCVTIYSPRSGRVRARVSVVGVEVVGVVVVGCEMLWRCIRIVGVGIDGGVEWGVVRVVGWW